MHGDRLSHHMKAWAKGGQQNANTEEERLIHFQRSWKTSESSLRPSSLPLMLVMYNLSCYKGRTYRIDPHSGYCPWHCSLNTVNHPDSSEHRKARHVNGFHNGSRPGSIAGARTSSVILCQCLLNNGNEHKQMKRARKGDSGDRRSAQR